jgi:hypothetical protein
MKAGIPFSALVGSYGDMYDKSNAAADGNRLISKTTVFDTIHHYTPQGKSPAFPTDGQEAAQPHILTVGAFAGIFLF